MYKASCPTLKTNKPIVTTAVKRRLVRGSMKNDRPKKIPRRRNPLSWLGFDR